ncbi:hypothetical protein AVEN_169088-1 [Araneus ventricosus]|uniref:Uncharacterized protein n=1 Tax=Araneus ventricosus TaxID=182803 RepID=A0A4Y2MIM1_ARAVE|nr:hypothetical protein AVEN_169088-1 [Araneus ventricosus]
MPSKNTKLYSPDAGMHPHTRTPPPPYLTVPRDHVVYILAADNGTSNVPKYSCYYIVPLFGIQPSALVFSSSTSMCPENCVTPHSGSIADRTNLSRSQQATDLQEKVKGRRRVLPHPNRPSQGSTD